MPKRGRTSKKRFIGLLEKAVKAHPWRECPAGQHYRRGATVSAYTTSSGKRVSSHHRHGTCVNNPSGKDQLYPEEIQEISGKHFSQFKVKPLKTLPEFKEAGNIYDHYIQGWTQYWNDVLKPFGSLDPDIVKALIASESSFNPRAWNKRHGPQRARGLTQITDQTLRYLSDDYSELRDHYLTLSEDDMLDPNLSICAGIRWLFRKKGLAEAKLKRKVTWIEAIAEYKGVNPTGKSSRDRRVMRTFDRYLAELKGKK